MLFSGQFKDAVQALLEWLQKVQKVLSEEGPVHGDLDTVMALAEQHKVSSGCGMTRRGVAWPSFYRILHVLSSFDHLICFGVIVTNI